LALPALVVVLFKIFLAPSNDLTTGQRDILALLLDLKRYRFILMNMGQAFWRIGGGLISLVGLLAVYSLMVGKTHQSMKGLRPLIFAALAQLTVYFFVYVTTPYDLEWHIQTSVGRLYLHVLPMLLLGLFLWLKTPNELLIEVK
jgi:hypothetical protein